MKGVDDAVQTVYSTLAKAPRVGRADVVEYSTAK